MSGSGQPGSAVASFTERRSRQWRSSAWTLPSASYFGTSSWLQMNSSSSPECMQHCPSSNSFCAAFAYLASSFGDRRSTGASFLGLYPGFRWMTCLTAWQ